MDDKNISVSDIAIAEKLLGIEYSQDERDLMVDNLEDLIAAAQAQRGVIFPNTLPPATLEAFRDHGKVARAIDTDMDDAESTFAGLTELGSDLDASTEKLQRDGVAAFANSFEDLLGALRNKV